MKKNVILISIVALLLNCSLSARTIKGTVISLDDSKALAGVSIVIKNNHGISTTFDIKGRYTIEASNSDILTFSFVGMKPQEVKVCNKTIINLALESEVLSIVEAELEIAECDEVVMCDMSAQRLKQRFLSVKCGDKKEYANYAAPLIIE